MRVALIDFYVCTWLLISAGVIALALRSSGIIRSWAMLLLIAWTTLPHLLDTFPGVSPKIIYLSPLGQIWESCSQGPEVPSAEAWNRLLVWLVVAGVLWSLNIALTLRKRVLNPVSESHTGEKG